METWNVSLQKPKRWQPICVSTSPRASPRLSDYRQRDFLSFAGLKGKNDLLGEEDKKLKQKSFRLSAGETETTAGENVPSARRRVGQLRRCRIIKFSVGFLHACSSPTGTSSLVGKHPVLRWGSSEANLQAVRIDFSGFHCGA